MPTTATEDPTKPRALAAWHRLFAENTENDRIRAARRRVAQDPDRQAERRDRAGPIVGRRIFG